MRGIGHLTAFWLHLFQLPYVVFPPKYFIVCVVAIIVRNGQRAKYKYEYKAMVGLWI
jgi:hypothetical protein